LYAFHKGHWYSISSIIWNQLHKFWDGVITHKASPTKSLGLPFPFLLTHILKKKGIKGTPEDGPVTNIHSSTGTSGTTASPICLERLELKFWLRKEERKHSIWKRMHWHHSKVGVPIL
jgi:hypothetical protein